MKNLFCIRIIALGRVLPAPKLVYGERETCSIVPREGVWNMRNMKFIEAKSMNHFGLINITRCGDREIDYFISALTKAGQDMGEGILGFPKCVFKELT